jgi:hypothetical protein
MNKTIALMGILLLMAFQAAEPPVKLTWQMMESIRFEDKYNEQAKGYIMYPKFTEQLKKLEGKIVEVVGFVVPVDKNGAYVALSANPYASCYFCGRGSPASVMTVRLKKPDNGYNIDDYTTFRGKLKLNATDVTEFYYILESSEEVK